MAIEVNNRQSVILQRERYKNSSEFRKNTQPDREGSCKNRMNGCDTVEISGQGRMTLEQKLSGLAKKPAGEVRHLSPVNAMSMQNDFEQALSELSSHTAGGTETENYRQEEAAAIKERFEPEQGEKTDSFDRHVNETACVYQMMKRGIEEKYADPDRKTEYYVAEDGRIQELSQEKEMEMLNKAYQNHSMLMASSTEIWSEMRNEQSDTASYAKDRSDSGTGTRQDGAAGSVKQTAYHAFLAAISSENEGLLEESRGSLNHFKLNLGIPAEDRDMLNDIWDYYANKR